MSPWDCRCVKTYNLWLFLQVALNAKHCLHFLYLPSWPIPHTAFFFFFRWDEWEKALVLQHVMAHKPLLSRWFPTLWRAESNPRGFTLCSQKQPSFACPMLQLLLSQWWAGCVLLQSLQKMGPLQSNFLSYLQGHFVSSLVRTGSNIWLQRQLLAWASFQARWK